MPDPRSQLWVPRGGLVERATDATLKRGGVLNDVDAMYSVKSGQLKPVYETFNPIDASRWRYGAALAVASFVDWRSYAGAEMTPPQTQSNTEPTYGNTGFFEHPSDSTYRARWGNPYGWETQFFNGGSLFSNWNPNWNTYVDTRNNDNKVVYIDVGMQFHRGALDPSWNIYDGWDNTPATCFAWPVGGIFQTDTNDGMPAAEDNTRKGVLLSVAQAHTQTWYQSGGYQVGAWSPPMTWFSTSKRPAGDPSPYSHGTWWDAPNPTWGHGTVPMYPDTSKPQFSGIRRLYMVGRRRIGTWYSNFYNTVKHYSSFGNDPYRYAHGVYDVWMTIDDLHLGTEATRTSALNDNGRARIRLEVMVTKAMTSPLYVWGSHINQANETPVVVVPALPANTWTEIEVDVLTLPTASNSGASAPTEGRGDYQGAMIRFYGAHRTNAEQITPVADNVQLLVRNPAIRSMTRGIYVRPPKPVEGSVVVNLTITKPEASTLYPGTYRFEAKVSDAMGIMPQGTITLMGQQLTIPANGVVGLDNQTVPAGGFMVEASLQSTNGFTAAPVSRSFYTLTLHTYNQTQTLYRQSNANYAGPYDGPVWNPTGMVTGDVSGKKARAFTHHDLPSKPQGDAYITSILLYYRNVGVGQWIGVGHHNLAQLPPTGSFGGAVYQDQFTIVADNNWQVKDCTLNFLDAMRDGWWRGLVLGSQESRPYAVTYNDAYLVINWQWQRWE